MENLEGELLQGLVGRKAVTLVDDEPSILDVLSRACCAIDFNCQSAATAEEAIGRLERHLTPVVVTDLRMPGRGGIWLIREVRRRWPDVAVIVLTVGGDEEVLRECLAAGVRHYFMKPIHLDEFHHALQTTWEAQAVRLRQRLRKVQLEATVRRQSRKVRRTFCSAITSLVRTLEARDAYTSGHSLRVRAYALRLADKLRLDATARKQLSLAARLHDIGKIGLPEGILNKVEPLTDDEVAQVRAHPVLGERILRPIIRNHAVLGAIRSHHERYDGTGYPDGLRGEQIPFLARLIAVADCYDAMTSSRAYRTPLSNAEALAALRDGRGSQFDPDLVLPFADIVRQRDACHTARR